MIVKEQELKILDKIDADIRSAGIESYIHDTFGNIVEICRNNIINDFGDYPVRDLADLRKKYDADMARKDAECGEKLLRLEHERDALESHLKEKDAEIERLNDEVHELTDIADEWEQNAHDAGELYQKLESECAEMSAEIIRLKAELYDYMKGARK